ncbi:hypothetical protein N7478_001509 [Penicillium angulare]|uniref:uncharacterized protein n=1 Tax=Penicillium angulare TaxID=116970 RepID=UPI0025405DBA|nr:uncharacterized protein N7478_001509 [Penicillium angulare]KAJ5288479.1 hypothetical protein N7478_001509 [Penicillium angulare]
MPPRSKRRRLTDPTEDHSHEICQPATQSQKGSWNGFCEIESEPALFNVMLREFGVKGAKVQEVISLDEEMMAFLHQPIYGLIFLFRWREDDTDKQEATCPDGLWFANQTADNACASVALLNIVNNIPDIDLGENLQHFKDFTRNFTPALRGDAVNNFEFVKRIHNSFARKMDILNSDLQLKSEARSKKRSKGQDAGETDATFHFIAFMPAMGQLWKFDGLERQPQALGECSQDDWLELARPNLVARMAAYEEEQIEFSILGVVRDPLPGLIQQLADNVRGLEVLTSRVMEENPNDIEAMMSGLPETVLGPDPSYDLTREVIDTATVSKEVSKILSSQSSLAEVQQRLQELIAEQRELLKNIREEQQSQRTDEDHATGRRYDYGPAVRTWLRFLAHKQLLGELLQGK